MKTIFNIMDKQNFKNRSKLLEQITGFLFVSKQLSLTLPTYFSFFKKQNTNI